MKILNSFSLNMINVEGEYGVKIKPIGQGADGINKGLGVIYDDDSRASGWKNTIQMESYIGHQQLLDIINPLIKGSKKLELNRATCSLLFGETVCVIQYTGPRLLEGTTQIPPGSTIVTYHVTIEQTHIHKFSEYEETELFKIKELCRWSNNTNSVVASFVPIIKKLWGQEIE